MDVVAEYAIGQEYIDVVPQLQERMVDDIGHRGIVIECCLSREENTGRHSRNHQYR